MKWANYNCRNSLECYLVQYFEYFNFLNSCVVAETWPLGNKNFCKLLDVAELLMGEGVIFGLCFGGIDENYEVGAIYDKRSLLFLLPYRRDFYIDENVGRLEN